MTRALLKKAHDKLLTCWPSTDFLLKEIGWYLSQAEAQQERKPMTENGAQYLALCHLPLSFRERGIAIVREVEAFHGIKETLKKHDRAEIAAQQDLKPDEWAPYLKEGETPFERFMRERADLDALMTLYRNVLAQQERKPHTEDEVQELFALLGFWRGQDEEETVRRILGVPEP